MAWLQFLSQAGALHFYGTRFVALVATSDAEAYYISQGFKFLHARAPGLVWAVCIVVWGVGLSVPNAAEKWPNRASKDWKHSAAALEPGRGVDVRQLSSLSRPERRVRLQVPLDDLCLGTHLPCAQLVCATCVTVRLKPFF